LRRRLFDFFLATAPTRSRFNASCETALVLNARYADAHIRAPKIRGVNIDSQHPSVLSSD